MEGKKKQTTLISRALGNHSSYFLNNIDIRYIFLEKGKEHMAPSNFGPFA